MKSLIIRKKINQDEKKLDEIILDKIESYFGFERIHKGVDKEKQKVNLMSLISYLLSLMSPNQKYKFYEKHILFKKEYYEMV